ncbi:aminotransferase class IV family protein [Roseinatronobacter sp.]|uniref:aminotransferase class IV family protein n=1 Tax=Roseinatronobacter sp. TaxID=1945755 RepID=UPI0025E03ED8|nr:aminotransferase class IV family protein [Rhodobaca sp.]
MESTLRKSVPHGTCLIETFGWYPGLRNAELHLARMGRSAKALGFPFAPAEARAKMHQDSIAPLRCRMTLDAQGRLDVTTTPLPEAPLRWRVRVAAERLRSDDPWLSVKSTERDFYDHMRAHLPDGVDEWLFLNERDELAEGTITNLFLVMPDGRKLTPAQDCGVLPGVLRGALLADGWSEARLNLLDLHRATQVFMGNALRGLIPADVTIPQEN